MFASLDREPSERVRRPRSLSAYLQDYDLSDLPTRPVPLPAEPSSSKVRQLPAEDFNSHDSRSASPISQPPASPVRWSVLDTWDSAEDWQRECHMLQREMEKLKIQNEQLKSRAERSQAHPEPVTVSARESRYREGVAYGAAPLRSKSTVHFQDWEPTPRREISHRQHFAHYPEYSRESADYRDSYRYDSASRQHSPLSVRSRHLPPARSYETRAEHYPPHTYEQVSCHRSPDRYASHQESRSSPRDYRSQSRHVDYYSERRHSPPPMRHESRHRAVSPPGGQERTYRGPTPTIPNFCRPNPREFARLRIALDNLLPSDATERFKFQILVDHLKLEEALLVADSYSNSDYPFSDTMAALNQQYGQPHQLALQRIAELMDGPNIQSGDIKSFRLFALNVRSLVSMLEQLGLKGQVELDCGSHVSRLLGKLPHDLRSSFRRYIHPLRIPIPSLLDLAEWLEYELQIQEDIAQYRTRKDLSSKPKDSKSAVKPSPRASVLMLGTETRSAVESSNAPHPSQALKKFCPFCDNHKHSLNSCPNFKFLSLSQKHSWIKDNNRCWRCGREHRSAECDLKMRCKTCNSRHLLALHEVGEKGPLRSDKPERKPDLVGANKSTLNQAAEEVLYIGKPPQSGRALLKISKVILRNGDQALETYAVLDDGSERTLLLHSGAQQLGLQGKPEDLPLRTVRQELQVLHGAAVSFTISPASSPTMVYNIQEAFTAPKLGLGQHSYPTKDLQAKYTHLRKLPIPAFKDIVPLLLIGSDHPHLVTPVEPVVFGPPGAPVAVRTRLGWSLQGPTHNLKQFLTDQRCFFTSFGNPPADIYHHVEKLWQMDVLPWRSEKISVRSRQDHEAIECLEKKTTRVEVDGVNRYATPLLRVKSFPNLSAPISAVLPQLRNTERRLVKAPDLAQVYNAEIQRLEQAGYVDRLPPGAENTTSSWYIPHHLVEHNGKPRVVFNCSFQFRDVDLNKLLLPGPNLSPSLLAVLLRFREHCVAFSSDIRGMFHQIRLLPEDKPLLRFLWRNLRRDLEPTVYQWNVLPFGTTCSPCCATYALQRHVTDHTQPDANVRNTVLRHFYVDNCLQSVESVQEAKSLITQLQKLLAEGGFELRQWASTHPETICHLPAELRSASAEKWIAQGHPGQQESALGLQWDCEKDTLSFKARVAVVPGEAVTMRSIYRVLASQYDPLGFLVPYSTRAKIIIQHLWDKKRDWDDPALPDHLLTAWREWEGELPLLRSIELPRCYTTPELDSSTCQREIHVFCDASEQAYGSVAYLRTESPQGVVQVAFITARSRVAPKKQQSIPRLELCAALTGAQLAKLLKTELTLPILRCVLWTDSTTVLTWLQSESCRFKVFVGTRVAEIQDLTAGDTWRYVESASNPADNITRGKPLASLMSDSPWGQGPTFLRCSPDTWPQTPQLQTDETPTDELKKPHFCGLTTTPSHLPDAKQFSSFKDLLAATIQSQHGAAAGSLTADDYQQAQLSLLQQVQLDSFPSDYAQLQSGKPVAKSSRLLKLAPEFDVNNQIIRVGGRLRHGDALEPDTVHPIVLDAKHPITFLLIQDYDEQLHHAGPERVFSEMRRKYWLPGGREAIRRFQRNCQECQKWRGRPQVPKMADLPPSRLRILKPAFFSTGVDCFGPYSVKSGRRSEKRWGIIFKCMTTRAVHIELLSSLDTDSFLLSMRRFIARRGKPFELISDQGTNFRGGERELREAFATLAPDLQAQLASQQIHWKFNPPNAPHFGGCWEREIRSVKQALQVTLGAQLVSAEVLHTLLVEIEGILNSKPLGYTSADIADPDPITPNSLLIGRPDASLPQVVYPASELLGSKRWRHSQLLADHFWRHFIRFYLPSLQARQKWNAENPDLHLGKTVLIVDPQLPRSLWPVGKVTSVSSGLDGKVRSAEVKVGDKTYTRPVARLIQLPELPENLGAAVEKAPLWPLSIRLETDSLSSLVLHLALPGLSSNPDTPWARSITDSRQSDGDLAISNIA
ncbi:hypothetical protein WMY93_024673 [Mugilogobius chulae]|uniref:ribonuclease H n=1 Tax=Mugilogobius chulae TaxID=88201 RepID=A0AAW0N1Y1_9GOBI